MKIFDTHAHYYDKRFAAELSGGAHELLSRVMPNPVCAVINVGTDCENARLAIEQAQRYDGMYAAIGIHPGDCHYAKDPDAELAKIRGLLGSAESRKAQKIVAIGEIGLDYYWQEYDGGIPMDKAKEAYFFDAQMSLAEELDLPVIIHDREAHGDCFDTVMRHPNVRGVFHSYSGSAEMARELVRRGWYISFSGTLTFKNAARVRQAAMAVPHDRLLIETDAPYLAPHPHRGKMNHSGLLRHTLETLAELWECSEEEASRQTYENAERLFLKHFFV
ncbi:MAG: TatD family deoxyribonuclease [Ruminococcaceae bacterium]|nr:TatD family deoxyribonuclease [Oscillospiraceae bacterium]